MLSYSGQYTGDGNASKTITGIPFTPQVILIKAGQDNTQDTWFKTKDMPAALSAPVRADLGLQTGRITALTADGFTVGNQTSTNQVNYPYYFLALADNGAGDFATIAYVGDNTDDKLVFSAWQPSYAFLKGDMAITGCRKFVGQVSALANQGSNAAIPNFQGAAPRFDLVYFGSDGMRVSNGSNSGGNLINQSGLMCYGFVVRNVSGLIAAGSYTGTGAANTVTTGVNPIFIDLQSNISSNAVVQYLGEQASGLTTPWDAATSTGKINGVTATGFTVGTDANSNTSGQTYWYMNMAQNTTPPTHNVNGLSSVNGLASLII